MQYEVFALNFVLTYVSNLKLEYEVPNRTAPNRIALTLICGAKPSLALPNHVKSALF